MAQLLDGLYADRKEFANIDAIGSSFLYHAVAASAVADGAVADGAVGSDIWRYR